MCLRWVALVERMFNQLFFSMAAYLLLEAVMRPVGKSWKYIINQLIVLRLFFCIALKLCVKRQSGTSLQNSVRFNKLCDQFSARIFPFREGGCL